jgi:hypothetical protein
MSEGGKEGHAMTGRQGRDLRHGGKLQRVLSKKTSANEILCEVVKIAQE